MAKFRMTHLYLSNSKPEEFEEVNVPNWLTSKEFNWLWEGYVMKLPVGGSIDTDFRKIERIE
jgi:hypothetical protein